VVEEATEASIFFIFFNDIIWRLSQYGYNIILGIVKVDLDL
jgi:hypothetical protein